MNIYTFDKKKNKFVKAGELKDKVFIKKVSQRHYFKIIQGYAISEDVIFKLQELGCEKILIIDKNKNQFETYLDQWLDREIHIAYYGHGRQFLMPCSRMRFV